MHKKDYLQRRFEEFGKVLAVILTLKRDKDWEKFETEIADATEKFTGLSLEATECQSDADFERTILSKPGLLQDQKKILATLLFEKLTFYLEKNDAENASLLKARCLTIYQHLQTNFTDNEFDLDVYYKLNFLRNL